MFFKSQIVTILYITYCQRDSRKGIICQYFKLHNALVHCNKTLKAPFRFQYVILGNIGEAIKVKISGF